MKKTDEKSRSGLLLAVGVGIGTWRMTQITMNYNFNNKGSLCHLKRAPFTTKESSNGAGTRASRSRFVRSRGRSFQVWNWYLELSKSRIPWKRYFSSEWLMYRATTTGFQAKGGSVELCQGERTLEMSTASGHWSDAYGQSFTFHIVVEVEVSS